MAPRRGGATRVFRTSLAQADRRSEHLAKDNGATDRGRVAQFLRQPPAMGPCGRRRRGSLDRLARGATLRLGALRLQLTQFLGEPTLALKFRGATIRHLRQRGGAACLLLLFVGHHDPRRGDGGGGPTEEDILRTRQLADFPLVPKMRHVNVTEWFQSIAARATAPLPKWVGEIYLEYHRGTLTTQGRTKYLHRRAERALIGAEVLGSMVALRGGAQPTPVQEAWQVLLRNEFHDILPGSSIR